MITALYNLFVKHNILPDEFLNKNETARRMLLAFSDYEIAQENNAKKKGH
ncbi:MAG: hypothetical protein ACRCX2_14255 [Paraclostridium sp.]